MPDLGRIDPDRWRDALIPLSPGLRTEAVLRSNLGDRAPKALERLTPEEHASLVVAAKVCSTRPAQLARTLTLNGTRRVLAEHDGALDRIRRRSEAADA